MATPFVYDTLPQGQFFRYLVLEPSTNYNLPLTGRLVTSEIDQAPAFDAISYVWGNPAQVSEISIIGHSNTICLTASLRDTLRRVRLPDRQRNVWADQICINQADLAERSHQVSLMAHIYRRSSMTLIHLGDATDEETSKVASLIADLSAILNSPNATETVLPTDAIAKDERWNTIAAMTKRPWFDRVWVVQEAGLSARPEILYGNLTIPWDEFFGSKGVMKWVQQRGTVIAYSYHLDWHGIHMDKELIWSPPSSSSSSSSSSAQGMATVVTGGPLPWSFLDIMHASRQLQATEPKDHLYGFLGHLAARHAGTGRFIVEPDYTKDVEEVHLEFATNWIEWTQDVDVLSFVQETGRFKSPSWVPSWVAYDSSVLAQLGEAMYRAGGGRVRVPPRFLDGGRKLSVNGMIFDKIRFLSDGFLGGDFYWERQEDLSAGTTVRQKKNDESDKWTSIFKAVLDPAVPFRAQHENESRLAACLSTVTAGLPMNMTNVKLDQAFAAFLAPYLDYIEAKIGREHFKPLEVMAGDMGGKDMPSLADSMEVAIAAPLINRRVVVTETGRYGLVPSTARMDDCVCICFGAKTPFVVRKVQGSNAEYTLVGECYIHGVMDGSQADSSASSEDIVLV
ncbi:heterokaryon incompatibility protein-domain-containing protein [Apodospora peruviana]|uniref:Heterokaryon incompatibility protein-domain-containing protein n=1 Tax=Apodospora peruviana TaxID=516989 RepID=A0AAE0IHK9_9PEZI|nr:heterokaryon incompatibility protein-domain-containing protein [Apodospora peruviana]